MTDFLSQSNLTIPDKVNAHIAYSNTFKSVLNYDEAIFYLELADQENNAPQKDIKLDVKIKFEKSLLLFDMHQYEEAFTLMEKIMPSISDLTDMEQAQFKMQLGYLEFKNNHLGKAKSTLQESADLMRHTAPRHLPIIFTKLMEVYSTEKNLGKILEMRDSSMLYVNKYNVENYQILTCDLYIKSMQFAGFESKISDTENCNKGNDRRVEFVKQNNKLTNSIIRTKLNLVEKEKKNNRILLMLMGFIGLSTFLLAYAYYYLKKANRKISTQNIELDQLNANKNDILAIIGHDIRKPATSFLGITQKINYMIKKGEYARIQQFGDSIEKNAIELTRLTDNLLNWAMVNKSSIQLQPKKLLVKDLVQESILGVNALARSKDIDIRLNLLPDSYIWADKNSMVIVIRNLVDNAIKYSNKGSTILIANEETNIINMLRIVDKGVGISQSKIKELNLGKLIKPTSGTHGETGTGLGLKLIYNLVTENKGTIEVSSDQRGTVFIVSLPKTHNNEKQPAKNLNR